MRIALLLASALVVAGQPPAPKAVTPFQVALDVSSDGKLVATCGDKVRVFEFESGKPLHTFEGTMSRKLAFSPAAGNLLAVGYEDGTVRLFDAAKGGAPRELKGHTGGVYSLAFDPSGKWLAAAARRTGNQEKKIEDAGGFKLWDVTTGEAVRTIEVQNAWPSAVAWSDDGKRVAFCRNARGENPSVTLEVFAAAPWAPVAAVKLPCDLKGTRFGNVARFLPGGTRVMVGGGVCVPVSAAEAAPYKFACRVTGLLWGVELGDKPAAKLLEEPRRGYYNALNLSPDGKRYVTHGAERTPGTGGIGSAVEVREVEGGKVVWQAADGPSGFGIRFTPDGKSVTALHAGYGSIRVYDASNGDVARLIPAAK